MPGNQVISTQCRNELSNFPKTLDCLVMSFYYNVVEKNIIIADIEQNKIIGGPTLIIGHFT